MQNAAYAVLSCTLWWHLSSASLSVKIKGKEQSIAAQIASLSFPCRPSGSCKIKIPFELLFCGISVDVSRSSGELSKSDWQWDDASQWNSHWASLSLDSPTNQGSDMFWRRLDRGQKPKIGQDTLNKRSGMGSISAKVENRYFLFQNWQWTTRS